MHTVINYDLPMETMPSISQSQWISLCAQRLHQRWRTVGLAQLEEVAGTIWQQPGLQCMQPDEAAALWLSPVALSPAHSPAA